MIYLTGPFQFCSVEPIGVRFRQLDYLTANRWLLPNLRYAVWMLSDPVQLRLKAEAFRRLADLAEDEQRKAVWIERAHHWEELAARAAKQTRPRKQPEL